MKPICHYEFDASQLVAQYPPKPKHRNKKIVFEIASPPDALHIGTLTFSRWHSVPLPDTLTRKDAHPQLELRDDYFTYETPPSGRMDWYLNFAHYDLFCAYGGPLFAQDEMQVAEHPALASLRQALIEADIQPLTVENGQPTPALIMGVERRCVVATDADLSQGRPYGLYGNHFARASEEVIRQATAVIAPPTISNILAMEAPAYSSGPDNRYTRQEITFILTTAITGYLAAIQESKIQPSTVTVAIHTGFWGCGAYGGNRVLMPLLQMIAACSAGLDRLVFHAGLDSAGYSAALDWLNQLLPVNQPIKVEELISQIENIGFEWGVSDGN